MTMPPHVGGRPSRSPGRGPTPTVNNHYVPKWYQRRFLTGGRSQFQYLDLSPDVIPGAPDRRRRTALNEWGPARCFCKEDLYSVHLGKALSDVFERRFFTPIDDIGRPAVEDFSDYDWRRGGGASFQKLLVYMSAQRFRTPRGLDLLKSLVGTADNSKALQTLSAAYQMYGAMWTEGVWEVVSADNTKTKFIVTDNPVTFYNKRGFPGSPYCHYPRDVTLDCVGTRTIFPLRNDRCLIITHTQYVRNPDLNPLQSRINARLFDEAMFDLRAVQTGRQLEEDEVLRINYILKKRAHRYIAAGEQEWLYPEEFASATHWSRLDDDWFLFPHLFKVTFSGGTAVGYRDGSSMAWDEHGRRRDQRGYRDEKLHQAEWKSHLKAQREWAIKRRGKSVGHVAQWDHVGDSGMKRAIAEHDEKSTTARHR